MMNNSYPKWIPEDFVNYVSSVKDGTLDYPFNIIDINNAHSLCLDSAQHKEFWQRFRKLLSKNENNLPSSEFLFTSLLLTIEHGKSLSAESWDTKTSQVRINEIQQNIKRLEIIKEWYQQLAPEESAAWRKLRTPGEKTVTQYSDASELEKSLYGLTVLRPFIAPEFIHSLEIQIDLLKSSLYQLSPNNSNPSQKTKNLAPFHSKKPQDTYLVRCLAYWFTKQFGSPKYNTLCDLASIILSYSVSVDSVKSAVRESNILNNKN
ncbi:hypothetical protein PDPUS_1_00275 [Photobacterium damselae subsp. piscicida]|uniref:Uncharacterized protein n=1 Tax=Photobacterium damsela subsp. piscicida TaxID=38294 RepID=A0A1V1V7W3_PHODP|nr:hypothetical protein [Photobacterium damselae]MBE8130338.1 hypothetical protein [Photobacterium damselae subsp. piscicida]QOD52504.1 hypothetical protein IC628_14355 [Photobacterium damselae subsp. piscicida]QOD56353.1 hypothetical protein IC627_14395 [Photobacterium damselae subsp. piscicida]BAX51650.1 hypothetical protein PDPUS_1_00275 [Photobacterium damselae subsp. piscicida]GAW44166.1 hypothetical protein PDPJ_1_01580 [Photobacterium damselae subsp. piscicida]